MSGSTRRSFLERTVQTSAGLWLMSRGDPLGAATATRPARQVADIQNLKVVSIDDAAGPVEEIRADIVIVGGGLGGVAAAMAACEAGRTVCLFEETDSLGGQATSQGVTALDDNGYIELSGATKQYMAFRNGIRDYYRKNTRLKPEAAANPRLNPGRGWGMLGFESAVGVRVLDEMLAFPRASGRLTCVMRAKAYAVGMEGDRLAYVDLIHLDSRRRYRARAGMFIDASELGDLLALGAADYITGAESKADTGEPHAADTADAEDVQSFTYSFVIEHRPGENHVIPRPPDYARNRDEQPYTLTLKYGDGRVLTYGVFVVRPQTYGSFWNYRRLIDASQFEDERYRHDLALINWPGNDYRGGTILVDDPTEQIAQLQAAQNLSLGFLHWLQTEVPRDDTGRGYPEFKLRRDLMGTPHGVAKFPYIRESRRIRAIKTILEQEVASKHRSEARAVHFDDSVGIGLYAIDLHESKRGKKQVIDPTKPFQIPLGALIPRRTTNLLAGCKNIGTTHITNGCCRLHPIEWAIGEAAGAAAALSIERSMTPREIREQTGLLRELQRRLVRRGAPIMWYDDIGPADPRFAEAQMLPFEKPEILAKLNSNLHAPR